MSRQSNKWTATAYVESQGPGDEKVIASTEVPVRGPEFADEESYEATIAVPADSLHSAQPDPNGESGVYKIVVTVFLSSKISSTRNYDVLGSIEGPIIKVEEPQTATVPA
ncbi:hypothetical protein [Actinoplanes solisilvae]|uniref:hypothetical protein n=1 Tax=Actinoplanes solisilvae TaxID=2486853 RepID=UPI000FD9E221|nr:hypothetical protein [Actinoplanes solisilvae]